MTTDRTTAPGNDAGTSRLIISPASGSDDSTADWRSALLGSGDTWSERFGHFGWALVPLRLFLAVAFIYAGLDKIADSSFLDSDSQTGLRATLEAVRPGSPIGGLLGPVQDHAFFFGVLFSIGEIAVGLGILFGLFTRLAALGGILLGLSFFLTISWAADPWYTGADIFVAFAFTPLLLAGSGGILSLDAWLQQARVAHPGTSVDRTRRGVLAGGIGLVGLIAIAGASFFRSSDGNANVADGPSPTPSPSGFADLAVSVGYAVHDSTEHRSHDCSANYGCGVARRHWLRARQDGRCSRRIRQEGQRRER